jgi:peptidoglycan/LPS O-acetylase OafA/YrhL
MLAALGAGVAILLPEEMTSLAGNAIAGALFSSNLRLLSEVGCFDLDAHAKPLLHLWSLGIEEQFYLAWPLALWFCPRRWRRVLLCGIIALSFGLNVALVKTHPAAAFYLPLTRAWELMAGAATAGIAIPSRGLRYLARNRLLLRHILRLRCRYRLSGMGRLGAGARHRADDPR